MKKLLVSIKKFLAIMISFIFGIFHKSVDKDVEEGNRKDPDKYSSPLKKKHKENRLFSDDDSNSKNISSTKNNEAEILYFAKKDIQKLMVIQDYIMKLEYEIENCNDLEILEYYKNQLEKEKNDLKKITSYYEKTDLNNNIIIDIKTIDKNCTDSIEKSEKELDKKIYKLEKEDKSPKESTEMVEKPFDDNKEEEQKLEDKVQKENLKEVETPEEDIEKENSNANAEKKILEEIVIIDTLVKETIEEKQKKQVSKKKETPSDNKVTEEKFENKISPEIENKKIVKNIEKTSKNSVHIEEKPKKYKLNKTNLEKNVTKLKLKRKVANVAVIAVILAQAKAIVGRANINQLINLNSSLVVNTLLTVNNQIRRSRSLLGRKVKKLKLEKVIRKVGPNPTIQVRAIIGNSLSELRKLKAELIAFGMEPEVIEALNTINELEFELLSQVNELESQNNLNRNRTR